MGKKSLHLKEIITGILFIILLFLLRSKLFEDILKNIYLYIYLLSFCVGFLFCLFLINTITKSENSVRIKIYASFIIGLSVCLSILMVTSLEKVDIDGGYYIMLDVISIASGIFMGAVLLTGIIISNIRRNSNSISINLKNFLLPFYLLIILLSVIFFSNPNVLVWLRAQNILP